MINTLIGKNAPDFCTAAVLQDGQITETFRLSEVIKDKYSLIFFYPLDFTFVCPSELIALDHKITEFQKRNIEVIGVSIDSVFTHHAWRETEVSQGGIGRIQYTLASDITHQIGNDYGIMHPDAGVALRAAILIDKHGIIRAQLVNDLPIGRSVDEILRLFDAIDFHEQYGDVCPANWKKGDDGMKADSKGVSDYLAKHGDEL